MYDETLPLIAYETLPRPKSTLDKYLSKLGDEIIKQTINVRNSISKFLDNVKHRDTRDIVHKSIPLFLPSSLVDPYEFSKETILTVFDATIGLPASMIQHYRYWGKKFSNLGPLRTRATVTSMFLDTVLFRLPSGIIEGINTYHTTGSIYQGLSTFTQIFFPTSIGYDLYQGFTAPFSSLRGKALGRATGKIMSLYLSGEVVKKLYSFIIKKVRVQQGYEILWKKLVQIPQKK